MIFGLFFGYGHATDQQYIEMLQESIQSQHYHGDIDLLLDYTFIQQLDFSYDSLKKILEIDNEYKSFEGFETYKIAGITRHLIDKSIVDLCKAMSRDTLIKFISFSDIKEALPR